MSCYPESSMANLLEYSSDFLSIDIYYSQYLGNLVPFSFRFSMAGTQSWLCVCETCDSPVVPLAEAVFLEALFYPETPMMPPRKHQKGFDFSEIHIFMPLSLLWLLPPRPFSVQQLTTQPQQHPYSQIFPHSCPSITLSCPFPLRYF